MSHREDMARLEALLFVAGDPLALEELADLLGRSLEETEGLVTELKGRYKRDPLSGLRVRELEGAVSIVTAADHKELIESFFWQYPGSEAD